MSSSASAFASSVSNFNFVLRCHSFNYSSSIWCSRLSVAASASKMPFLAPAFALALVDEVRDVRYVGEERDARDTRERVPTFDTLSLV